MPDIIDDKKASGTQRLVGGDEEHAVDVVEYDNGEKRVLVDARTSPIPVGELFTEKILNGTSPSMNVDGTPTPVVFRLPLSNMDRIVTSINIYGRDAGIKYGQFLAERALDNGIILRMKSEDKVFSFIPIKTTDDLRNVVTVTPSDFVIDVSSGEDSFTASFIPPAPFYIKKQSEYSSSDYIEIVVQDDIDKVAYLECIVKGAFE